MKKGRLRGTYDSMTIGNQIFTSIADFVTDAKSVKKSAQQILHSLNYVNSHLFITLSGKLYQTLIKTPVCGINYYIEVKFQNEFALQDFHVYHMYFCQQDATILVSY